MYDQAVPEGKLIQALQFDSPDDVFMFHAEDIQAVQQFDFALGGCHGNVQFAWIKGVGDK